MTDDERASSTDGFSHDESRVATVAGGTAAHLYLGTLGPAGESMMEARDVPLAGAGRLDHFLFSPDDAQLARTGDPNDDGSEHVYLAVPRRATRASPSNSTT